MLVRCQPGYPGSSPRMRGALVRIRQDVQRSGIIPADAGSTAIVDLGDVMRRDHPRGCGEHGVEPAYCLVIPGSSPRMRGAPYTSYKTQIHSQDHPRGCGEHISLTISATLS